MAVDEVTSERYREVKEILGAALECAVDGRPALLDARCGGDRSLRREVESLLEFESSDVLSGEPLVSIRPDAGPDREGERLGPYRILRRLGYGGMGVVYLAEQEEDVQRRVALKLIHRGMDTDEILRRFQLERQILAKLNHPYIARLLDAGVTEDGRPYFAMDYVDGVPIDAYCERERLSVRERVELFRKVCDAVQFSHQNLVIHRDLKPGNIFIVRDGTPRLLDFGIAKLLDPAPFSLALTTVSERRPMTPAYASPELIRREGAGTASDVYSLGVMLYRLLAGRPPYELAGLGAYEVERIVCEEEPRRPSTVVGGPALASELPAARPGRLKRELAGDLDGIVLKALSKKPGDRYPSVESFSDDLRRFLEGLPVKVREGTWAYRAAKFVRRHRLELATAVLFLAMVAGFVVALLFQVQRTSAERNRANMSRDLFVEIVENTDPEEEEKSLTPAGVVQRGVDLFGDAFLGERRVQASVFDSLGRVYMNRGFYDHARELLDEALAIRRELLGEDHLLVAESRLNLAQLLGSTGEGERAVELSRRGLDALSLHRGAPRQQVAKAISNHATQLYKVGRLEEAEPLYREALEMKIALYGEEHLGVATSWAVLGNLLRDQDRFDEARRSYLRALEIRRRLLPPRHPKLAKSYSHIGTYLLDQEAYDEAEPILREALAIRRDKHGEGHPDVATSRYRLALALRRLERYDEAEPLFRQALAVRCETLGDEHTGCASVKRSLAKLLLDRGAPAAAEDLAREALAAFTRSGPAWRTTDAEGVVAECLAARGRYAEAEEAMLRTRSALLESLGEEAAPTRDADRRLVDLYEAWGRPRLAAPYRRPR